MLCYAAFHLGLHCLQKKPFRGFQSTQGYNLCCCFLKKSKLYNFIYKLPRTLNAMLHVACLSHGMCLYQVMMTLPFLKDVAYDAESAKIENYVKIASLKSETMGKLIPVN